VAGLGERLVRIGKTIGEVVEHAGKAAADLAEEAVAVDRAAAVGTHPQPSRTVKRTGEMSAKVPGKTADAGEMSAAAERRVERDLWAVKDGVNEIVQASGVQFEGLGRRVEVLAHVKAAVPAEAGVSSARMAGEGSPMIQGLQPQNQPNLHRLLLHHKILSVWEEL
jgi:hypothetical protein